MPRDAKPMPEPPTHTPMILMAAFAVLAGAGVVYALKTRASVKSVFHPKIWLSIFGIPFSILPILSWAPAVGLPSGNNVLRCLLATGENWVFNNRAPSAKSAGQLWSCG